ncbi:MAG: hypothetical protein ACO1NO_04965 [Burkholderiaceae bacterium]
MLNTNVAAGRNIPMRWLAWPFLCAMFTFGFGDVHADANYETSASGNTYASGDDVNIANPVRGDLIAFGGRIDVDGEVAADAALAGGTITVRAPTGQDLRAAAGSVNINSAIGADLVAAGGRIVLEKAALVNGSAWLAGNDILIKGKVRKGARIAGRKITLSGTIEGDATLIGEEIRLLAGSAITGNLRYSSGRPIDRDPQASIGGSITQEDMPPQVHRAREGTRILSWLHPLFVLSMLATGLVLYRFFPAPVIAIQQTAESRPARSLLIGLAMIFTLPPVAILLIMTMLGIPLGLALLFLYPLLFLAGYVAAGFIVGGRIAGIAGRRPLRTLAMQGLFLGLGLVVLNMLLLIPILGGIVFFLAVAMGIGGLAHWAFSARKSEDATADG